MGVTKECERPEYWHVSGQELPLANYRHGDIIKLPTHDKTEILIFIGKTRNSTNRGPDKSEAYEIIRKNSRFWSSESLVKADLGMEYHDWV